MLSFNIYGGLNVWSFNKSKKETKSLTKGAKPLTYEELQKECEYAIMENEWIRNEYYKKFGYKPYYNPYYKSCYYLDNEYTNKGITFNEIFKQLYVLQVSYESVNNENIKLNNELMALRAKNESLERENARK